MKTCNNCWHSAGTPRLRNERLCLATGLLVAVAGPGLGCCPRWRARPSLATIARTAAANRLADEVDRLTHALQLFTDSQAVASAGCSDGTEERCEWCGGSGNHKCELCRGTGWVKKTREE